VRHAVTDAETQSSYRCRIHLEMAHVATQIIKMLLMIQLPTPPCPRTLVYQINHFATEPVIASGAVHHDR